MSDESNIYNLLAKLLQYPDGEYRQTAGEAAATLSRLLGDARSKMERFYNHLSGLSQVEIEELFTCTFDLNQQCAPEIGWHLYGERYERGSFMVMMRSELRRHGVEESSELPDHLSHALALLGRMADDEAREFAGSCLLPAMEKMMEHLKAKSNPYAGLLEAIAEFIESKHIIIKEMAHG